MSVDRTLHQTVYPSLRYRDARAAIDWLVAVLGFNVDLLVPGEDDSIAHAQLSHGSSAVMLGSVSGGADGRLQVETGPSWVYIVVDEVEPHYAGALAAGAEVVEPMRNEDYGGRGYTVRDPEGNVWSVGSYRPEPPA